MAGSALCAILTQTGQVLLWPWLDAADPDRAPAINALVDQDVIRISCGDEFGCALTQKGEIFVYGAPVNGTSQPAVHFPHFRGQGVVDVHCCFNHGVVVTETGLVRCFELSEAHGSSGSGGHISAAAAQPKTIEPLSGLGVQRAWILPVSHCYPYQSCSCCIVGLTEAGALYVCPAPFNQQRWVHQMGPGAVLIKGIEGSKIVQVETASEVLLARTDDGQVCGWFSFDKFPAMQPANVGKSWNASYYRTRWPSYISPVNQLLGSSSVNGLATDGYQVRNFSRFHPTFFLYDSNLCRFSLGDKITKN